MTLTVDFDDLIYDYDGLMFRCPECDMEILISHWVSTGCRYCDAAPEPITIHPNDD